MSGLEKEVAMERYTILCTQEQTQKALELGAPIKQTEHQEDLVNVDYTIDVNVATILPTAEQMLGWLEDQGLELYTYKPIDKWVIDISGNDFCFMVDECNSRKEATLAAIDAALEYLSNNQKK